MRCWVLGLPSPLPVPCLLPPWLVHPPLKPPTFSSREATLKARSVTLPAAQRAALEECSSFQMVSVSTCGGQSQGPPHPRPPTGAGASGAAPTPQLGPQGQGAGQTALPPPCPTAQRQGLPCPPVPAQLLPSFSPHHQPASGQHSAGSIAPASPVRGGGMALPGRDLGFGPGGGFKPLLTLLRPSGWSELEGPSAPLSSTQGP